MDEAKLQEIEAQADGSCSGDDRETMTALVAEVRRLAAALDAARREGAEGMRGRLAAIWDARAAEHDATADRFRASRETDLAVDYERWAQRDRAEATAIRALPLDAPGGGS